MKPRKKDRERKRKIAHCARVLLEVGLRGEEGGGVVRATHLERCRDSRRQFFLFYLKLPAR